jgi:plastocyanin
MRPGPCCSIMIAIVMVAGLVPAQAETFRVTIDKLDFSPVTVRARVGDTVEWINNDIVAHTATVRGDWDVTIASHKTASLMLKKPGDVEYYCRFHPNMKGHISIARSE